MIKRTLLAFAVLGLLASPASLRAAEPTPLVFQPSPLDPGAPQQKPNNPRFLERHEIFLKRAKSGPIGLLFLGDSITELWSRAPEVWTKYYSTYHPANFGIGGDLTQHVVWRIEHGELDGIDPKVVVLMIGTNNTASHTAAQIVAADRKIVQMIFDRLPRTRVLLLALLPRGPRMQNGNVWDDSVMRMQAIHEINRELAKLDDGDRIRFLDFGAKFLDAQGNIPNELMPDQIHPSPAGYQLWADAMDPLLKQMMSEPAPTKTK